VTDACAGLSQPSISPFGSPRHDDAPARRRRPNASRSGHCRQFRRGLRPVVRPTHPDAPTNSTCTTASSSPRGARCPRRPRARARHRPHAQPLLTLRGLGHLPSEACTTSSVPLSRKRITCRSIRRTRFQYDARCDAAVDGSPGTGGPCR
jgi:hypothetical protein